MPNNRRLSELFTPAGKGPTFSAATGMRSSNVEKVLVFGSFLTNLTSNPVTASNRGDPFAVVRTSAGLYTVTLGAATVALGQYGVKEFISIFVHLGKGAAGNTLRAHLGLVVDASGTFQVRLEDALGAATDLAAGTDNRIHFQAAFSNGAL